MGAESPLYPRAASVLHSESRLLSLLAVKKFFIAAAKVYGLWLFIALPLVAVCGLVAGELRVTLSSSTKALSFSSAWTTKRLPSPPVGVSNPDCSPPAILSETLTERVDETKRQ